MGTSLITVKLLLRVGTIWGKHHHHHNYYYLTPTQCPFPDGRVHPASSTDAMPYTVLESDGIS